MFVGRGSMAVEYIIDEYRCRAVTAVAWTAEHALAEPCVQNVVVDIYVMFQRNCA